MYAIVRYCFCRSVRVLYPLAAYLGELVLVHAIGEWSKTEAKVGQLTLPSWLADGDERVPSPVRATASPRCRFRTGTSTGR